jgi:hypothetical protein
MEPAWEVAEGMHAYATQPGGMTAAMDTQSAGPCTGVPKS